MRHIARRSHRSNPFSQLVNELFDATIDHPINRHVPPTNIIEYDEKYSIEMVVPGMAKEDFDIKIEKDQLTVSASTEPKEDASDEDSKVIRSEFRQRSFSRSFHLSDEIDSDGIEAKYDLGILRLDLRKKAEVVIPTKKIEIS